MNKLNFLTLVHPTLISCVLVRWERLKKLASNRKRKILSQKKKVQFCQFSLLKQFKPTIESI